MALPRIQFKLRTIFWLTTAVAMLCATAQVEAVSLPPEPAAKFAVFLWIVMATLAIFDSKQPQDFQRPPPADRELHQAEGSKTGRRTSTMVE
ncbi:MAG TPA: hypothetical protein VJ783_00820 [Pirellulales bacterium]|nr:hypothetical protein [Pirellulales bacterium]